MGSKPILCVCVCVSIDAMLNFDDDVDANANVKCEHTFTRAAVTRSAQMEECRLNEAFSLWEDVLDFSRELRIFTLNFCRKSNMIIPKHVNVKFFSKL